MMAKPSRAAFACLGFQFPDSAEDGILRAAVKSTRASAMTHKAITLKFVVPTAAALGIILSIGAVYLKDKYFPINQAKLITPSPAAAESMCCQTQTGGFRAFTCCFPV
jgi:hypothetical protein